MKIEVEYDDDEVNTMLMAKHAARFGDAPAGDEWVVTSRYGSTIHTVANETIKVAPAESEGADDAGSEVTA